VNSVGLKWNLTNQVTSWLAAGRNVSDATAANTALGISSLGANQRFTYYTQDGFVSNMRNELRTNIAPGVADTLLPPSIFPYDVNWAGPSTRLTRDFSNYQVSLEQRVTDSLTVQAIYLKNKTSALARSFVYNGNTEDFMGDPNLTIPAPNGTGTIANPRKGQLFFETNENSDQTIAENEIKRLTLAYEFKLGKWFGNHRLAALGERAVKTNYTRARREILVDQNNRPPDRSGQRAKPALSPQLRDGRRQLDLCADRPLHAARALQLQRTHGQFAHGQHRGAKLGQRYHQPHARDAELVVRQPAEHDARLPPGQHHLSG
jgi:hypothetical protein